MIKKQNLAVFLGNALEYYDFMLYGFFAALLAPLFFPSDNPTVSLIASMGGYGIGFIARPLGGAVFGHFGDRFGRKNTLSLTLLLLALPTFGIALLPTYAVIGIWAPFLLISLRFLQGFCLGGETSGVMTYIIENSKGQERDMSSVYLVMSCYVGTLVGVMVGAVFTMSFMPDWAWRFAFVIGSLIAVVGFYVRRKLRESEEFSNAKGTGILVKKPFVEILKDQKVHLVQSAGIASAIVVPFFIIFIYLNGILSKDLGWGSSSVLMLNSALMVFWIAGLPVVGYLAKSYGRKQVMSAGLLGMGIVSYPLFTLVSSHPSFEMILITQLVLCVFSMAYAGPSSAHLVDLFPVNKRYSGIAVGYSLGHAIFGGFTPVVLTTLAQYLEMGLAPAVFIICSCGLGYFGLIQLDHFKETKPVLGLNPTS